MTEDLTRIRLVREWQAKVDLNDAELYDEYAARIRAAAPFVNQRAIDERAHQFVDQNFVRRLHDLAEKLG